MIHYITKQLNPRITLALITLFFTTQIFASDNLTIDNKISIINDSNFLRQAEKNSDTAFVYAPTIKFTGLSTKHSFELNYAGDFNKFERNELLDYNSHSINLITRLEATSKLSSFIRFGYQDTIEQPGRTDVTTGILDTFNELSRKNVFARLQYGNRQSIGQIRFAVRYDDYEYTNNDQEFRDYKANRLISSFHYRVTPKTRLLFQANFSDLNYNDRILSNTLTLNQSSTIVEFSTGVEWYHSEKFEGVFTIGYQSQSYEDDTFNDLDALSYSLDTVWKPTPYTEIILNAERETEESALINSSAFIKNSFDLGIEHKISDRTNVIANFGLQNNDIVSTDNRTDKRSFIELGLQHELLTWLNIEFSLKREERKSDISTFEFDANIAELSINIKLD